jgi:hypothetical protein
MTVRDAVTVLVRSAVSALLAHPALQVRAQEADVLADPHAREVAAAGGVGDPGRATEKSFAAWAALSRGSCRSMGLTSRLSCLGIAGSGSVDFSFVD